MCLSRPPFVEAFVPVGVTLSQKAVAKTALVVCVLLLTVALALMAYAGVFEALF